MKTDTIYKRAFNQALDLIGRIEAGQSLPTENEIARDIDVSRTTVRKVLQTLAGRGLISGGLPRFRTPMPIGSKDRYPDAETVPISDHVEKSFMQWILKDDPRPGTIINELQLARRFGVATTLVREFLNRFQKFGLIEKRRNGRWVFKGFTQEFALELFEVRELYEMRSALRFIELPAQSTIWGKLRLMRQDHLDLLEDIDHRFHDFSELDSQFHKLVISASPNRFIDSFYDVMTLVFHYHYQWKKHDERQRNEVAIREHLAYIDALLDRDPRRIETACAAHLASARHTLIQSTEG